MELYYKPNKRGGARITVTDDMPDEVKAAQRAIAATQGLLPVSNVMPRPAATPFGVYAERMLPVTDEYGGVTGYSQSWVFSPTRIHLSQSRLVADPAIAPLVATLAPMLQQDEKLASWWANDMTYVRGSEMAQKAMEVFGMTQEQVEAIVLRCRG